MKKTLIGLLGMALTWNVGAEEMGAYFDPSLDYSREGGGRVEAHDLEVDQVTPRESAMLDRIYFKFGPAWSSVSRYGDHPSDAYPRMAVQAAFEYERPVTDEFSLSAGLGYLEKGIDLPSQNYSMRLNYLMLPLQAKFNFQLGDRHRVALAIGPYLAYAIRAAEMEVGEFGEGLREIPSNDRFLSNFDYGGRFGLDYEFSVKPGFSFLIGTAYDLGLANLQWTSLQSQSTRALLTHIGLGMRI